MVFFKEEIRVGRLDVDVTTSPPPPPKKTQRNQGNKILRSLNVCYKVEGQHALCDRTCILKFISRNPHVGAYVIVCLK